MKKSAWSAHMSQRLHFLFLLGVLVLLSSGCNAPTDTVARVMNATGMGSVAASEHLDCQAPNVDNYLKQHCRGALKASQLMWREGCISAKHFASYRCLLADADVRFCPSEADGTRPSYNTSIALIADNITVDCQSRIIDQGYSSSKGKQAGGVKRPGIRAPKNQSLSNIVITNCGIQNTGFSGIELMRHFRGGELNHALKGHEYIRIEKTDIKNTKVGVYVGQASRGIMLDQVTVTTTQNSGVYIEADSRDVTIRYAHIEGSAEREGVSIDSASHNVIEHSVIKNHAQGAINVYKNCGELAGVVCPITRSTPANNNIIRHNTLEGDVNVAWRQEKFYIGGFCQDLDGKAGRYQDDAELNHIYDNKITCKKGDTGIVLNDANNTVRNNRFVGAGCGVSTISNVSRFSSAKNKSLTIDQ